MAGALSMVVAAAALFTAGCGGSASHPQPDQPDKPATTASVPLTRPEACQRLLADIKHDGDLDLPAIADVADHAADPRLAADARTVYRDLMHNNVSPLGLLLLQDDCAKAGVRLPLP